MPAALLPGSFDPPNLGHLDIIRRASSLFSPLYVGIAINVNRHSYLLPPERKLHLLRSLTRDIDNCQVVLVEGLVVDFAAENKIDLLVRGLRSGKDFDYESIIRGANLKLSGIDTVFLMSSPFYQHISSSIVREIAAFGGPLHQFVPDEVERELKSLEENGSLRNFRPIP